MKKQLYTCTCPAEKEFRLFLDLGQCLDYAIAHGPESHTPILMSDPIGMLWVAECVLHGDDAGYLVILGPVFDAAASLQTLQNCLRGMNLSVSLTATIMEKLEQIIETYRLTIQKAELELRNARKRIYYISLLRLVLFVGAIAGTIIFWPDGWLYISIFATVSFTHLTLPTN